MNFENLPNRKPVMLENYNQNKLWKNSDKQASLKCRINWINFETNQIENIELENYNENNLTKTIFGRIVTNGPA